MSEEIKFKTVFKGADEMQIKLQQAADLFDQLNKVLAEIKEIELDISIIPG